MPPLTSYNQSNKNYFEEEKEFFDNAEPEILCNDIFKEFYQENGFKKGHAGIMYCKKNSVDLFLYAQRKTAHMVGQNYISNQKEFSAVAKFYIGKYFQYRVARMSVSVLENAQEKKYMVGICHFYAHEFTYEQMTSEDAMNGKLEIFESAQVASDLKRHIGRPVSDIEGNLLNVLTNLYRFLRGQVSIVFAAGNQSNCQKCCKHHFAHLIESLATQYGISVVYADQLENVKLCDNILVVEMVTDVEPYRALLAQIREAAPSSAIAYLSVYRELTKYQLSSIRKSYNNQT